MSPNVATIVQALIAGILTLAGVVFGYALARRASEADRHTEALVTIYKNVELTKTLYVAFQQKKIDAARLNRDWAYSTEKIMDALFHSSLSGKEIERALLAINGKWEDPNSVKALGDLADELLSKLNPEYSQAAKELLKKLGVKAEDIDPVILRKG